MTTYLCVNCGAKQSNKYIKAMEKAGFSLWQLSCDTCGEKLNFVITKRTNSKKREGVEKEKNVKKCKEMAKEKEK